MEDGQADGHRRQTTANLSEHPSVRTIQKKKLVKHFSSSALAAEENKQHLLVLTNMTLLMIEVLVSKDLKPKPEVLWCVRLKNLKKILHNDTNNHKNHKNHNDANNTNNNSVHNNKSVVNDKNALNEINQNKSSFGSSSSFTIIKKSKIAKSHLEKLGKSGIWKGRVCVTNDQHELSWSFKKKKLGEMKFNPNGCRCLGKKIAISGLMISNRKKKQGKIKHIILRASSIKNAAEYCGSMKDLIVNVKSVTPDRIHRFLTKIKEIVKLNVDDIKAKDENVEGDGDGDGDGNEVSEESDDDDDDEEEEEEDGEKEDVEGVENSSVVRRHERTDSLDSLASITSLDLEDEMTF